MHWILFGVVLILVQTHNNSYTNVTNNKQHRQFLISSEQHRTTAIIAAHTNDTEQLLLSLHTKDDCCNLKGCTSHPPHNQQKSSSSSNTATIIVTPPLPASLRSHAFAYATPLPQVLPLKLNPYIRHWEAARFDRAELEVANQYHQYRRLERRRRRDITAATVGHGPASVVRLNFHAHDRHFRLVLHEDPSSVFAPDVEIANTIEPVDYDTTRVYVGVLEDDEHSYVHGILTADNLFDGTISTRLEQYYVEPAARYSRELHDSGVHTIVYRVSDVRDATGTPNAAHCSSEQLYRRLKRQQRRAKRWLPDEPDQRNPTVPLDLDVPYNDAPSFVQPTEFPSQPQWTTRKHRPFGDTQNPNSDLNLRNTYTHRNGILLTGTYDESTAKSNLSHRFSTTLSPSSGILSGSSSRPSHKTHVEIITKNGATKKPYIIGANYNPNEKSITNQNGFNLNLNVQNELGAGSNGGAGGLHKLSYEKKSTCMLYLQADHTFSAKMGSDEASIEAITRHVQRANVIYKNTDFNGDGKPDNITFMIKRIKVHNQNALKDSSYRFPGNYGVEKFLELFSEEDYDAFCLAYMFTYRDFEMGTLGLAWTGDLKNAGGVCEKNGHYRGSLKSLNTGIVTLLNYGKHVPPAVSHVTLAHEIGHNFGSPHDPEQCTPGGEDGNYIMFARATSGDKQNNNKFSPCSLKSIEPVLNAKARSAKGCFTEPQQSICGNGVVEPGEQCDCGWEEDCKDTCCFPMSRHSNINERPCTLTPRSSCSPSQGPCCTTECTLKFGDKCRDDNGCRDPSYCDGGMAQCPPSVNKPNKTICNKEFVCYMGECTGSICLAYGLESCQCLPGPGDPKTKACELCCKVPGEQRPCKSSFEWNEPPFDVPDMFAKPGTPCNDYNGYCDVFQKCREVDPSGPLATLRKLLLSEESIASFKKWIQSNWYSVALIMLAVGVLLTLSTKLLGKRTNLKLKTVTIIHSATTETVRLPDDNNGVIVHTAIRTKVPLKQKVRGERSKAGDHGGGNKRSSNNNNLIAGVGGKVNKKKKRVAATAVIADEQTTKTVVADLLAPQKQKKQKKIAKSKHKEIIDYSNRTAGDEVNGGGVAGSASGAVHTNTFGKVQRWLLESPIVSQPFTQIEHRSKNTNIMSKSQSTPERLAQRSPKKIKSVGNLNEKVKLQVVYKPPFKFSLKLSKNPTTVKTHVVVQNGAAAAAVANGIQAMNRAKRKTRPIASDPKKRSSLDDKQRGQRRTALLVRTEESVVEEDTTAIASEPNYETLTPKKDANIGPVYENLPGGDSSGHFSTATFRINRSTSGTYLPGSVTSVNQVAGTTKQRSISTTTPTFGSTQNLSQSGNLSRRQSRASFDTKRADGIGNVSPLNLSRSSTTNLSRDGHSHAAAMSRHRDSPFSSTVNLRRDTSSTTNLIPIGDEPPQQHHSSRGRKKSDLKMPSLRRGSIGSIPRASLSGAGSFSRQTSLQTRESAAKRKETSGRPQTANCDDIGNRFDWPPMHHSSGTDLQLPSDLEVMVSDIENLVNEQS